MKGLLLSLWALWKRGALWLAERQATVVYALLYYIVVGSVALVRRPFADPFQYRRRHRDSFWIPRVQAAPGLEEARRQ